MEFTPITGITIGVVGLLVLTGIGMTVWGVGTYNSLVEEEESVNGQWAQVQNQYQRKVDLIPQLIEQAENYMTFESSTLTNITALRSQWMNAETIEEKENISNALDAQVQSIIVTIESYPNLDSIEAVTSLMYSLEGTENRIATERMRYNEAVKDYNAHIKKFPAKIIADMNDFDERSYFESSNAPPAP